MNAREGHKKIAFDSLERGYWNISKAKENMPWQIKEHSVMLCLAQTALYQMDWCATTIWEDTQVCVIETKYLSESGLTFMEKESVYFPCQ